jgi:hypothetical protein
MRRVMYIAKFIGNDKDLQTRKWGIKKGNPYFVDIRTLGIFERWWKGWDIEADVDGGGIRVLIPYSNMHTFKANWKILHKENYV